MIRYSINFKRLYCFKNFKSFFFNKENCYHNTFLLRMFSYVQFRNVDMTDVIIQSSDYYFVIIIIIIIIIIINSYSLSKSDLYLYDVFHPVVSRVCDVIENLSARVGSDYSVCVCVCVCVCVSVTCL